MPENFLIPSLVAQVGGVAVHRRRIATALSAGLSLRIDDFPFPLPSVDVDLIWNPRLSDDTFVSWLREVLHDAAAEFAPLDGPRPAPDHVESAHLHAVRPSRRRTCTPARLEQWASRQLPRHCVN